MAEGDTKVEEAVAMVEGEVLVCATLSRRENAQEVVDADSLMREQEVVEVRTISFIRVHSYERSAHSHFPCH